MAGSQLEQAIATFRDQLLAYDGRALGAVLQSYEPIRQNLIAQIGQLLDLAAANPGQDLFKLTRAQDLLAQIDAETATLAAKIGPLVSTAQAVVINEAGDYQQQLAVLSATTPALAAEISATWNQLPTSALSDLVGRLSDGSPLNDWLAKFGDETAQSLKESLTQGLALGLHPSVVAAQMAAQTDVAGSRLAALTRTSMLDSFRSSSLAQYADNSDLLDGWIWTCANDDTTCAACLALDGQLFPLDQTFFEAHVNCFPAGTMVSGPQAIAGTERWYSGDLIEVETERGRRLSVTPNHPILTTKGWVAAGLLNESHNLVCRGGSEDGAIVQGNDDDVPARIEEKVRAFGRGEFVRSKRMPATPEDFHGDGIGSQVYVVTTNGLLRDYGYPASYQHARQVFFCWRCVRNAFLSGARRLHDLFVGANATANGLMSGFGEIASFLCGHLRVPQIHAFASVAGLNASMKQPSAYGRPYDPERGRQRFLGFSGEISPYDLAIINAKLRARRGRSLFRTDAISVRLGSKQTAFLQLGNEPASAETANGFADSFGSFPGNVTSDRVLKFSRRAFVGHVYNLETVTGWYYAGGIITHNCRCTPRPSIKGIDTTVKQSGADFFASLSPEQQDATLGKAGGQAYRDGTVTLQDFVGVQKSEVWGDRFVQNSLKGALAASGGDGG